MLKKVFSFCFICFSFSPLLVAKADNSSGQWSTEKAWEWYEKNDWPVGFNFVPSTAVNTTEFWSAESFDPVTIDRELGLAAELGFNTCRVFLQYLVWKEDSKGMMKRFDSFLKIASKYSISVMPVFFDDCTFGDPVIRDPHLGKQREPIPGMVLSSWTSSPGLSHVEEYIAFASYREYVKSFVTQFSKDKRIIAWDLYNEPGNSSMGNRTLVLLVSAFAWARESNPTQPLTAGVWSDLPELNQVQCGMSDIISFHQYTGEFAMWIKIKEMKAYNRPVLCTEWMARPLGSKWETDLMLFKNEGVGCYCWGLVNGRTQTQFPWWNKQGDVEPDNWFHDLFYTDGRPYRESEHQVIRSLTKDKRINYKLRDYKRVIPRSFDHEPGEVPVFDDRVTCGSGWSVWTGDGPRFSSLLISSAKGSKLNFMFTGKKLVLLFKKGPDCGKATIMLDGKIAVKELDTYAKEINWNAKYLISDSLKTGTHTLTIISEGTANMHSDNTYIQVAGFETDN